MKNYIIEVSRTVEEDLENIILYIRNALAGNVVADKYKIMFKQELLNLVFYELDMRLWIGRSF